MEALHDIGIDIMNPLTNEELFVSGDYWNGKIDVRDRFGKERVMSLREQRTFVNANEYKAIKELYYWLRNSDAIWSALNPTLLISAYEVAQIKVA